MISGFNEMPGGKFGRHAYLAGRWTADHARFLMDNAFPMVTLEGAWGDCSALIEFGESIRWLRVLNADRRIDGVASLPQLEELIVEFEPHDLSPLLHAPKLKTLDIVSKRPDAILAHPSLRLLRVVGAAGFSGQARSDSIEELRLVRVGTSSLDGWPTLPCLESLDLYGCSKLTSLDGIHQFGSLRSLRIEASANLIDVGALSRMPKLKRLSLIRTGLRVLPKFDCRSALEFLHIGTTPIEIDWRYLLSQSLLSEVMVLVTPRCADEAAIMEAADANAVRLSGLTVAPGRGPRLVRFCITRE
jgi:hypothetical protein